MMGGMQMTLSYKIWIEDLLRLKMKDLTVVSTVLNDQELAIIGSLAVIKDAEINSFPLFPICSQGSSDMTDFFW